ncbi:MAG: hypothetical protein MHMPM18_004644 [Marteilia pararefringens]
MHISLTLLRALSVECHNCGGISLATRFAATKQTPISAKHKVNLNFSDSPSPTIHEKRAIAFGGEQRRQAAPNLCDLAI